MENFIHTFQLTNLKLCDDLIEYHIKQNEFKFDGMAGFKIDYDTKKSTDVHVLPYSSNKTIKKYINHLQEAYFSYIKKYKFCPKNIQTLDPLMIQHYKKGEGFRAWHSERLHIVDRVSTV